LGPAQDRIARAQRRHRRLDCELLEIIERDNVAICLGRAVAARVGDGDPLVFFKGRFGGWVGADN
jgi:flavin reductase (DIM6/NTAB) family NADH-FMN oxidoreductase RutF